MIRKNYIRSIMVVGGSVVVALPPAFVRRKKLAQGLKIVMMDEMDYITIKCLDEKTLAELDLENKQRYNLVETNRVRILSKKYRQTKINKQYGSKVKWQNAKMK